MTTTRLAIPLFGEEVAPRFCFADEVLIAEVVDDAVVSTQRLEMDGVAWPERLGQLAASGVSLLLCGGFNRRFRPAADSRGIRVVWGLEGRADRLIGVFCREGLDGVQSHSCTRQRCRSPRSVPTPLESAPPRGRGRPWGWRGPNRH